MPTDLLLTVSSVLEKVLGAIPIAGSPLQSLFGVTTIILQRCQALSESADQLLELACNAGELLLYLKHQLQVYQDEIPTGVVDSIADIENVFNDIKNMLDKTARTSHIKSFFGRGVSSKEVSRLASKLAVAKERFSILISLDMLIALSKLEQTQLVATQVHETSVPRESNDATLSTNLGLEIVGRRDVILGRQLSSNRCSQFPHHELITVNNYQGISTAFKSQVIVKTFTSADKRELKKFFYKQTELRALFLDSSVIQMYGKGKFSEENFVQIYHSPGMKPALTFPAWYNNLAYRDPQKLAMSLKYMSESLKGWDSISVAHKFTLLFDPFSKFGELARYWLSNAVVEEDDGRVNLIYAGELVSKDDPPTLSPTIFVESKSGNNMSIILKHGVRYYTPAEPSSIYPSIQVSLPTLFTNLSEGVRPHTFYNYDLRSKTGEVLELGNVGYIDERREFVVLHRIPFDELSRICGITPYAEPETEGFELMDGEMRLLVIATRTEILEQKRHTISFTHGRHCQSEFRTRTWLFENAKTIIKNSGEDFDLASLLIIGDKVHRKRLYWTVQLKSGVLEESLPQNADWSLPVYLTILSPKSDDMDSLQVKFALAEDVNGKELYDISWEWDATFQLQHYRYSCMRCMRSEPQYYTVHREGPNKESVLDVEGSLSRLPSS